MTLKSAFEDLSRTTLKAIAGCLRKLEYLAGLRERERDYLHWGFRRITARPAQIKPLLRHIMKWCLRSFRRLWAAYWQTLKAPATLPEFG